LYSGASAATVSLAGCTGQGESTDPEPEAAADSDEPAEPDLLEETDISETESEESDLDLEFLDGITGQTYPDDLDAEGHYDRRYEWEAVGYEWWYEQQLPRTLEA